MVELTAGGSERDGRAPKAGSARLPADPSGLLGRLPKHKEPLMLDDSTCALQEDSSEIAQPDQGRLGRRALVRDLRGAAA